MKSVTHTNKSNIGRENHGKWQCLAMMLNSNDDYESPTPSGAVSRASYVLSSFIE